MFDGRIACYPAYKNIRDYLSWRQADCHINNLYNTCFWLLTEECLAKSAPKEGQTESEDHLAKRVRKARQDAYELLQPTNSASKNELLFQRGINYAKLPELLRKGCILVKKTACLPIQAEMSRKEKRAAKAAQKVPKEVALANMDALKEAKRLAKENKAAGGVEGLSNSLAILEIAKASDGEGFVKPETWVEIRTSYLLHEDIIGDKFWETNPNILV